MGHVELIVLFLLVAVAVLTAMARVLDVPLYEFRGRRLRQRAGDRADGEQPDENLDKRSVVYQRTVDQRLEI